MLLTFLNLFKLSRLHKFPAGVELVFWPCAWSALMAAHSASNVTDHALAISLLKLALGSTVLHSAACVINDICDKDFDAQVERTKTRPLVTGELSIFAAWLFLVSLVALYLGIINTQSDLAFYSALFGVFPLHTFYPFMKRITYWPQAWLGWTMNWGVMIAWLDINHQISKPETIGPLFLSTWCWSIVYDTIYACQDRTDDVKAGVKSTALLFGTKVKPILSLFVLGIISGLTSAGYNNGQGRFFYAISVGGCAMHLLWQLVTLKEDNPIDCWRKFKSNGMLGLIVSLGLAIDYVEAKHGPVF